MGLSLTNHPCLCTSLQVVSKAKLTIVIVPHHVDVISRRDGKLEKQRPHQEDSAMKPPPPRTSTFLLLLPLPSPGPLLVDIIILIHEMLREASHLWAATGRPGHENPPRTTHSPLLPSPAVPPLIKKTCAPTSPSHFLTLDILSPLSCGWDGTRSEAGHQRKLDQSSQPIHLSLFFLKAGVFAY
jgi:hypothetical protein